MNKQVAKSQALQDDLDIKYTEIEVRVLQVSVKEGIYIFIVFQIAKHADSMGQVSIAAL